MKDWEDQPNYTVKAAAARTGRSVRTIERWIQQGMRCRTVSGILVIDHKVLIDFFRARLMSDPARTRREE